MHESSFKVNGKYQTSLRALFVFVWLPLLGYIDASNVKSIITWVYCWLQHFLAFHLLVPLSTLLTNPVEMQKSSMGSR